MSWTERQHAMLEAMGLRLWSPPGPGVAAGGAPAPAPVPRSARSAATPAGATGAGGHGSSPADRPVSPARPPSAPVAAVPSGAGAAPATPSAASGAVAPLPAAVAHPAADWAELREAVAACQACTLCQSRRQTVFGVGHPQAHWLVVGEAPGAQEDLQGEPFVGPAGQLLDAMLRALGLTREAEGPPPARVYIANTLKCRPPGNRNPAPDELARCEPFLVRQVEFVKPRIILAMGRFAVHALLRTSEPIGRLRGRVHRYQGVPLVVTYHPAYLLRNPADKARAWEDLCLAADTYDAGEVAA